MSPHPPVVSTIPLAVKLIVERTHRLSTLELPGCRSVNPLVIAAVLPYLSNLVNFAYCCSSPKAGYSYSVFRTRPHVVFLSPAVNNAMKRCVFFMNKSAYPLGPMNFVCGYRQVID